jgi:hypothetical protein
MESILELFNVNNIRYIVSVDDCYINELDEILLLGDIIENPEKYDEKFKSIRPDFNLLQTMKYPDNIKEKMIEKFLLDFSTDEKIEINKLFSTKDQLLTTQKDNLLNFLNDLQKIGAINEYKTFGSVSEAREFLKDGIKDLWDPSEEKKVLWLIDREFGEKSNEGFKLLEDFCSENYQWNIGILATQNTSDIKSEEQFNSFLEVVSAGILGENKNLIWLIDKDLIDINSSEKFVETIMLGLRRNYTFKITNFLSNTISIGIQEALVSFKDIEQSTINNIILKFSNQEGTSIIETLTRVLMALTKYDMNEKIAENFDNIHKIIDNYEKLCEKITIDSIANLDEVFQFRNKEKYNNHVNEHYYPVGFGDIFRINELEYILISQPCDIQIRGDKGERNLQQATLLRITKTKPEHESYSVLEYYHKTETYYVLYRETLLIDFTILDLCSMNENGKSVLKLSELNKPLTFPYRYNFGQRKRLEKVLGLLGDVYNQKKDILTTFEQIKKYISNSSDKNIEEINSTLDNYIYRSEKYWEPLLTVNNLKIVDEELRYPVERICRLEELFTTNIMLEYSSNSSRLGLPGDYGSHFRHTEYKIMVENPNSYFGVENHLIDISRNLTVLLSDNDADIFSKVIGDFIKDNVSPSIEEVITKNPRSFIKINRNEKQIILPSDYLVSEGKEYISFSKQTITITDKFFSEYTPNFYKLISILLGNMEFIKTYNLFNFYRGKVLNENVNFKFELFKENIFSLEIEGRNILEIELELKETNEGTFDFSFNLKENNQNIKWILEDYLVKK